MSKPTVTEYILAQAIVNHWHIQQDDLALHCPYCNGYQKDYTETHSPTCPVILARMIIEQAHPQE